MPDPKQQDVPLEDMLGILEKAAPRSLTVKEIAERLGIDRYDRRRMAAVLDMQADARRLHRVGKTRYRYAHEVVEKKARPMRKRRGPTEVIGRYCRVRGGYGFLEAEGPKIESMRGDMMIPRGREGIALHGDRVRAEIVRRDHRTGRSSGRVVAVVERAHTEILGTLQLIAGPRWRSIPTGWRLVPVSELLPPIEVVGETPPRKEDAGRMALVRLTHPPAGSNPWRGQVVRLLGEMDDPEVQFLQVALEHGLRLEFSASATAEAVRLPHDPRPADLENREDLRDVPFVTIDGETARDFDDAVCLEDNADGGFGLRVAIADVSHYVKPGSALDAEAALRGTSVYFPDRAIPMLPERLSNELCSLKPGRDRAVLVADMEYDGQGRRTATRLFRAAIRSQARLTYTEVSAILDGTDTPEASSRRTELAALVPQLDRMRVLMRLLYARRLAAGALDLNLPESVVDLSDDGHAVGVRFVERNDAHRIIEEFMLEANQAVAGELADAEVPIPYRIHEPPEKNDVYELNRLLHSAGVHVETKSDITPAAIATALHELKGHRLERVLSKQVLRALKRAQYDPENVGHFGLAFSLYCHFTSPIRRYPDLLVHRQLVEWIEGRGARARGAGPEIAAASEASSRREREAMGAERAMADLKKVEFMKGHLHEPGKATVVSLAGFGFFAELDAYPVEGLVRIEDLDGEWRFDEKAQVLYGVRSGRRIQLGDRVVVEASDVSLARRQVTLQVIEMLESPARRSPSPATDRGRPSTDGPKGRGGHDGESRGYKGPRNTDGPSGGRGRPRPGGSTSGLRNTDGPGGGRGRPRPGGSTSGPRGGGSGPGRNGPPRGPKAPPRGGGPRR
ncbi:MAG: ribonuclease R [Candidatus Binatia bacterium]|nr:ribonuclease R [Candidatus Binatia bacterium]